MRVESRSEILEAREREMEIHRDAVEGHLLIEDSQFTSDTGTQSVLEIQCSETQTAANVLKRKHIL